MQEGLIRVAYYFIYNVKKICFFASGECFAIDNNLLMGDYNPTTAEKIARIIQSKDNRDF